MDEKDVLKTSMEVALRPLTAITEDALGLIGGDWLSEKRKRNRARLRRETEKLLNERSAKIDTDPSPSVVMPLLTAAQDESRDELVDVWAKLCAFASDPATRDRYRREFVDIAKALEPLDTLVLPILAQPGDLAPSKIEFIAAKLAVSRDQVELSFRNLHKLGLAEPAMHQILNARAQPHMTAVGRQFLAAVR